MFVLRAQKEVCVQNFAGGVAIQRISVDNDVCESMNAMVGKLKEKSPNISTNVATSIVTCRKNLAFFDCSTVQDFYDIVETGHGHEFLQRLDDHIHGRGPLGKSQNQVQRDSRPTD